MITGAQIRAARALLNWSQTQLAKEAKVGAVAVNALEQDKDAKVSTLVAIERAFAEAGVLFLEPGVNRDGGAGVRMKEK